MGKNHFESLYPDTSWKSEISRILAYAKEGNSSQIIGLPGVGRSNLLKILSFNSAVLEKHLGANKQWFLCVLVDFSEIKNKSALELKKFLFLSILDALRDNGKQDEYEKVNNIFKESLCPNVILVSEERAHPGSLGDSGQARITVHDELVLFNGLKRAIDFLSIEKELTVVFLFDKFETCIKNVSGDLFSELAVLRSRAKYRFSIVFSLDRPLEDYFEPSFLGNLYPTLAGHDIYLPLSDASSIEFRIAYIEKTTGKTLPEDIKKYVSQLTGGHGNYTRIAVEELFSNFAVISSVARDLSSSIRDDKLFEFLVNNRAIRSVSYELWETLTAEEQKFLKHVISSGARNPNEISRRDAPRDDKKKNYLENSGLITFSDSGQARMTIPLFEDFVKFRAEQKTIEKILFDPQTGEIKKGEFSISDQFTGLEFRLLKFFAENENTIINRETIINSVWKDISSTAGVTDQALDQLIFRLRKKIEENPNNPIHLQTIKGRGFKFIS